jgi:hypothetical protein
VEDFTPEEGRRAFGALLRQERLTRLRPGRFQVAGDARFHPTRRAG